jgi:hypothetical protein
MLFYQVSKLFYQVSELQRVMNASARLVCCATRLCHITPALLRELHWLPTSMRIEFKILLIPFKNFERSSIRISKGSCIGFTTI